ncbi:MAG: hypothetical protein F6K30_13750 [Cyanothece sp. SIO2G6]|nr:hypothetical protein [Cyanothece sp. SIO2G6]
MKNINLQLPWERTISNNNAVLSVRKKNRLTPSLSRKLALIKMKNITVISDEFNGEPILFYPLSWVCLESSDKLKFEGVYASDNESNDKGLPKICIRRANWFKEREKTVVEAMPEGSNMNEYLFGRDHVQSEIYFCIDDERIFKMNNLINDKVLKEANFYPNSEENPEYSYLTIYTSDDSSEIRFSYSLFKKRERSIEKWINDWRELLISIKDELRINSDKKTQISYQESLIDYIKELNFSE